MPAATLSVLNFYAGTSGVANGSSLFTDLSGKFAPSVVGSSLLVNNVSYPITQWMASTTISVTGFIPSGTGLPWTISSPITNGQNFTVDELPTAGYVLQFFATATETSPNLLNPPVSLIFDYGDGALPPAVTGNGYVEGTYTYRYTPGTYRITATALNFQYPINVEKSIFFNLTVRSANPPPSTSSPYVLVGPVLPSDSGYPDAEEWNLNIDVDDKVIASNVKMLMITSPGERLMDPNYGTQIRNAIFDMDASAIQTFLQEQITTALATYEPRAQLTGFTFNLDPTTRTATLNLQLKSLITQNVIVSTVVLNG